MVIRPETSSRWLADCHNQQLRGRHLILSGNVSDRLLVNEKYRTLRQFLDEYFQEQGYQVIAHYDIVDGLQFTAPEMEAVFGRLHGRSTAAAGEPIHTSPSSARQSHPFGPAEPAAGSNPAGGERQTASRQRQGPAASSPAVSDRVPMLRAPENALPDLR